MRISWRRRKVGGLAFLLCALACSWVALDLMFDVLAANRATAWPTAEGTVLSSKVQQGCGKGRSYFPSVLYQYTVNAQQYQGRRIAFGNCGCGSERSAAAIVARYAVGTTVTVHFDPAAPMTSVLLAGAVFGETWVGIGVTSLIAVLGGCFAYFLLRPSATSV
mgnify:CR=1 FL=1